MMERQFAKFFISLVKELISEDGEREKLFDALRHYQTNQDLQELLTDLRLLLNEPNKLELYDFMRPIILMRHQIEYSRRVPPVPGVKLRVVRLQRHPGESLGFAVRGGYEHGVGIFVTDVSPGSQADRQGLQVGDELVRVNGFTIAEAIHDDVLNLIRSRDEIILKVTYIGMLPVKENPEDPVKWHYVDNLDENYDEVDYNETPQRARQRTPELKIFVDSSGHASIGCSIISERGSTARFPGIYVEKVRPGSIADQVGLEAGDQIMEVNETSFRNISWTEAVLALKSSRQLNITIRKKAGSRLVERISTPGSANGTFGDVSPASRQASYEAPNQRTPSPPPPPVASPTSKPSPLPSPEAQERSSWDETQLIQQHLNLHPTRPQVPAQPPSPTTSSKSGASSKISTSAEIHTTSPSGLQDRGGSEPSAYSSSNFTLTSGPQDRSSNKTSAYSSNFTLSSGPQDRSSNETSAYSGSDFTGSHASPLSGAAAAMADRKLHSGGSNRVGLLGEPEDFEWRDKLPQRYYQLFDPMDLDGRPLLRLTYKKTSDLGIDVEGGLGSPLGGRILVAMVFDGGVAKKCGQVHVGDQLMMLNGQSLVDIPVATAEKMLADAASTSNEMVELLYCETTFINDEDSMTYF